MTRPPNLAEYNDPPVVEVVLSVQFDDIVGFDHVHVASIWEMLRDQFPDRAVHPPLAPVFEMFGGTAGGHFPPFEMLSVPPLPRFWFLKADKSELVQFQTTRFIHNWRKVGAGDKYPRYEHIRDKFLAEIELLRQLLAREGLPDLAFNQCEITYVNHIPIEPATAPADVFSTWKDIDHPILGRAEDVRFRQHFVMRDGDGSASGRLVADMHRAQDEKGKAIHNFTLTARGRPSNASVHAVQGFFDRGRECIVSGFSVLTTSKMHRKWGKVEQ